MGSEAEGGISGEGRSFRRLRSMASFGFVGSSGSFLKPSGFSLDTVGDSPSRSASGSGGRAALPVIWPFMAISGANTSRAAG